MAITSVRTEKWLLSIGVRQLFITLYRVFAPEPFPLTGIHKLCIDTNQHLLKYLHFSLCCFFLLIGSGIRLAATYADP
jgi:hypothetical protein